MLALHPAFSFLAVTFWGWFHVLLEVIGVIGLIFILIFLFLMLSMIPDFLRYLKIKSM